MKRTYSLVLFLTLLLVGCSPKPTLIAQPDATIQPTATPISSPVTLGAITFMHPCLEGQTALASLEESVDSVSIKESSLGKLVIGIEGKEQGDGKYWMYNIDGKEASVGADAYQCQGTETITWELK